MIADSFLLLFLSFYPPSSDKDTNTPKNHIQLENNSEFPSSKDHLRIQDFTSEWVWTCHIFESLQQI